MIQELANKIWSRDEFQKEYRELVRQQLQKLTGISVDVTLFDEVKLKRLLQVATTFSATQDHRFREAANRIALSIWNLYGDKYRNLHEVIKFILGRMGNFPTMNLFQQKTEQVRQESFERRSLPIRLGMEVVTREEENSVMLNDGSHIVFTDFQVELWKGLKSGASISVSAPTSAGKSFALQRFIAEKAITAHDYIAAYIVPTRALINQVSASLLDLLSKAEDNTLEVITIPLPPSHLVGKRKIIYVLTQERLHNLISEAQIDFNLVVIDESQLISADETTDNSRGVMLQTVVENVLKKSQMTQIMFASPLTKNPEVFREVFKIDELTPIMEDETPVPQNLFLLDLNQFNSIKIRALIQDQEYVLGSKETFVGKTMLNTDYKTLAQLAWEFGQNEKNIVYTNGADTCEKISDFLKSKVETLSTAAASTRKKDIELEDFAEFVKEHVHHDYRLAEVLSYGIAFHYGNMPAVIRKTVEELFEEGKINYLVCTSTLLHGVNLPAKNLFLLKPNKGKKPISSIEFWNLAGRAGRMGKDFSGNVYMINVDKWSANPLEGDKKQGIVPSYKYYITDKSKELLDYINDEEHRSGLSGMQGIENSFVKLFNDYRSGELDYLNSSDRSNELLIIDAMKRVDSIVTLPEHLLQKNINVSPYRQQKMYDFFIKQIENGDVMTLIPKHPSSEWGVADPNLREIFRNIHVLFEGIENNSHKYYAPLALKWMRGDSLSRLIQDDFDYKKSKAVSENKKPPNINSVIREVMEKIETILRFKYVKYTSCYIDLLVEALTETENETFIDKIPSIPLFLELGASSVTMISFISLGVSRTTSSILTELTNNRNMDREAAKTWVLKSNVESLPISGVCKREILRTFSIG